MNMKKIIYIYTLTDPKDNLIKYVGQSYRPNHRFNEHLRNYSGTLISNWIQKLVKENLQPILEIIDECEIEDWIWVERYWISQFRTWGFPLKNSTDGGDGSFGVTPWNKGMIGVFNHSQKSKLLMSEKRKGLPKILNSGIKWTNENRVIFSERMKGNSFGKGKGSNLNKKVYLYDLNGNLLKIYLAGKDAINDGFKKSSVSKACKYNVIYKNHIFSFKEIVDFNKESYEKKNVWNKGLSGIYKHTEDVKKEMSKSRIGKKINLDVKGVKNPNSKKLYKYDVNFNLIKIYDYVKLIEEDGFVYKTVISRCQNNNLKPYKNYIFSYLNLHQ